MRYVWTAVIATLTTTAAFAQQPPQTMTLKDALSLAERNNSQVLAASLDVALAREDRSQARASLFPSLSGKSEYLGTEGNGRISTGRFVTNDGVHVYRDWAVVRQDLSPGTLTRSGEQRASAAEALARAKLEITRRGLRATITKLYYNLLAAQRKYATAQQALDQAERALITSRDLERGGEVAHSDVVKSQLQQISTQQAFQESRLTMESARLDLAVMLFRDFNENFSIVDDLDLAPPLPSLEEVRTLAARENPSIRAAMELVRASIIETTIARQAYLPTLTIEADYGIEANAVALRSTVAVDPRLGPLPNLGYFITASLNVPVWDWGVRRSKVRQAEIKHNQAEADLSADQRTLMRNLRGAYDEADTARSQTALLRTAADLASEGLRLNTLRYQAGEATILELVDAQSALIQARNAFDDGMVRYQVAIGNLQTLTGTF